MRVRGRAPSRPVRQGDEQPKSRVGMEGIMNQNIKKQIWQNQNAIELPSGVEGQEIPASAS